VFWIIQLQFCLNNSRVNDNVLFKGGKTGYKIKSVDLSPDFSFIPPDGEHELMRYRTTKVRLMGTT
jgi:hypothetical protein